MTLCDFGKKYTTDESAGCQEEARYLLQYSADWKLLEGDPNHPHAADMELYSCEKHVSDISFVFDSSHGLPKRILDLTSDEEQPNLVRTIEKAHEAH